jgi:hypothetical protein
VTTWRAAFIAVAARLFNHLEPTEQAQRKLPCVIAGWP